MKYYVKEHLAGYHRIHAEGKAAWGQLHGEHDFEASEIRGVLEEVLPLLRFDTPHPSALEYGCGTGPGACFLAQRGMRACGIDQSPLAIEMARREAAKRGLAIDYRVGDVCAIVPGDERFDLVLDAFCLQCIVTEADRRKLFAFVRAALKPAGYYVIATAGFCSDRDYGDCVFDPATGVVLEPLHSSADEFEDARQIDGRWLLPCRRHPTAAALSQELSAAGFTIEWHRVAADGDIALIARLAGHV